MKYEIWKKENCYVEKENGMVLYPLIPSEKIEEAVYFFEPCFFLSSKKETARDVLKLIEDLDRNEEKRSKMENDFLENYPSSSMLNEEDVQEFFEKEGYDLCVEILSEWEFVKNDGLVFFPKDFSFCRFDDLEKSKVYQYWNGSNWKILYLESYELAEEVVVSKEEACLDRWDGSSFYTENKFMHQYVRKVLEIDGEKVDDLYLLIQTSDYQGDIPAATILDKEELKEYLESIDRDINDYIEFDDPRY